MSDDTRFEEMWELLCRGLSSPQQVRNWTAWSGYLGEDFTAVCRGAEIVCTLPSGSVISVPRGDFERVYEMWSGYLAGRVRRVDIREVTRSSKYIISMFHQFLG